MKITIFMNTLFAITIMFWQLIFATDPEVFDLINTPEEQYDEKIRSYLDRGLDLNATNSYQANVLTEAASHGLDSLISILLDYRDNPNIVGCH